MWWRMLVRWLVLSAGMAIAGSAWPEGIVQVLDRSQQMRLDSLEVSAVDSARARTLQADFDRLVRSLEFDQPVTLRVVRAPLWAETLLGRVVVANEALADLPEGARLFILAHELGHVRLGHWAQMGLLFRQWVPGDVTPQHTDAVASRLGSDASALAHRQEFEADAYAQRALRRIGVSSGDMLAVFRQIGGDDDTATHPSANERIEALETQAAHDRSNVAAAPR
ncbi:MAG: M48 family metalloprotease [Proteobacteria bacterium]|nr:M48 family metalloprotease [Pseudomonadota bacterium]